MNDIKKTVYCISLGCVRNLVDTEVMLGFLTQDQYRIISDLEAADIVLVNTCGFLEEAREEVFDVLDEVFSNKASHAKVVVAGCMVNKFSDQLKETYPDIHYYLGSGDISAVTKACSFSGKGEVISQEKSFLEKVDTPRLITTPSHYSYLKIAEGCMKACSYCLIPSIKGFLKSKSIDQVLAEFDEMLSRGVFEIILVAQDLGDFGKDRKEKNALITLIKAMLKRKEHFWLRLLYHYPEDLDDELIELMASDDRICPYLDMPIQHIDETILKAMRRRVTSSQIVDTIEKLHKNVKDFSLRTTLMVGFPGEEEAHFQRLLNFVQESPIEHIGVFSFSPEKGTLAAKMAGQVPEEIKDKRVDALMGLQQKKIKTLQQNRIGEEIDVLVESYHPESELLLVGRHQGQAPEVDGQVIINDPTGVDSLGKVFRVKITQAAGYDLVGNLVT